MKDSKYNIDQLDFSKCAVNPIKDNACLVKELQKKHADFQRYFGEFFHRRRAKLFRYIIFVYDKNSPLLKKEPKLEGRKLQSVLLADLKIQGEIPEEIIKLMEGFHDDLENIYAAIARYMLLNPDPLHISLATYYQLLIGYNVEVSKGGGVKNNNMAKAIRETTTNIMETEKLMFGGDEGSEIRRIITNSMNIKDIKFRPEKVARRRNEQSTSNT